MDLEVIESMREKVRVLVFGAATMIQGTGTTSDDWLAIQEDLEAAAKIVAKIADLCLEQ